MLFENSHSGSWGVSTRSGQPAISRADARDLSVSRASRRPDRSRCSATRARAQTKFAAAIDAGTAQNQRGVGTGLSRRAATWQANTVLPTPDVPNTTHNASGSSPRGQTVELGQTDRVPTGGQGRQLLR